MSDMQTTTATGSENSTSIPMDEPEKVWGKAHTEGCARSFRQLKDLLAADLTRYSGRADTKSFMKHFIATPGFKYTVWMRLCGYLKINPVTRHWLYYFVKYMLLRCRYKFGIAIPEYTVIGPGLFINRFGGIYVHGDSVIGSNVNFTHGVVLGYMNRGERQGAPIVGDESFLGSGAKVIGHIRLGKRSAVGANAVVTKDFPDDSVVGGIPAKLLSSQGSEGYINNKAGPVADYPPRFR
ncbi:serine acetyltransferase [Rhizobium skierniewicense]|uniref:serine O-acetyltransferase n=1 Tax=Rhizobium skierniewicense TaxID=984260 RepID=UPI000695ECB1|nr:serine acetyltransferase [Rhizobium skierniewicense]MCI9868149.1 serine acetyltransferase [Rhizobium skierniewicense]